MKKGVQFDKNGDFVGDFLEGMTLPKGHKLVEGNIQDGLYKPKLVNGVVVEGLTLEEITAITFRSYADLRRSEYPPIGDQLDAIWKAFTPPAGSEAEKMKADILAIKAKYPKPMTPA